MTPHHCLTCKKPVSRFVAELNNDTNAWHLTASCHGQREKRVVSMDVFDTGTRLDFFATEIDRVLDADECRFRVHRDGPARTWWTTWGADGESASRHVIVSGPPAFKSPDGDASTTRVTARSQAPEFELGDRVRCVEPSNRAGECGTVRVCRNGGDIVTMILDDGTGQYTAPASYFEPAPRFVVTRGAEAVGCYAVGAWDNEQGARDQAHNMSPTTSGWRVSADSPVRRDLWFVVDTEAPRVERDGMPAPLMQFATTTPVDISHLKPTPPTDAEIVALDDQRRQMDAHRTPFSGSAPTEIAWRGRPISDAEVDAARDRIAKATPPTDEWLARFLETEIRAMSDEPDRPVLFGSRRGGTFDVNGHRFTVADMRAAWSRVLAAKVRASDEQRRLDAMVYGPIDDLEEV